MKKLIMNFPEGLRGALDRRHNGALHTETEILGVYSLLESHYKILLQYRKKLDHLLNVEWDKKNIEGHFGEPIFYGAHRRLKRYEKIIAEKHKVMFTLLTHFDGNYDQVFSQFGVISPDDIMEDFKGKYMAEVK